MKLTHYLRVFTKPVVPGDEGKPTKKGLTLRPGTWREVLEALQRELTAGSEGGDNGPAGL